MKRYKAYIYINGQFKKVKGIITENPKTLFTADSKDFYESNNKIFYLSDKYQRYIPYIN